MRQQGTEAETGKRKSEEGTQNRQSRNPEKVGVVSDVGVLGMGLYRRFWSWRDSDAGLIGKYVIQIADFGVWLWPKATSRTKPPRNLRATAISVTASTEKPARPSLGKQQHLATNDAAVLCYRPPARKCTSENRSSHRGPGKTCHTALAEWGTESHSDARSHNPSVHALDLQAAMPVRTNPAGKRPSADRQRRT